MSETVHYSTRPLSRRPCAAEPGHDRRDRASSGILACELEALTPLCIHSAFRALADDQPPVIPGSSLRGMVRNMMEMLGAGCLRLVDRAGPGAPPELAPCSQSSACIACRVFGFTEGDFSWASKVLFSDARPFRERDGWSFTWTHCVLARRYSGPAAQSSAWNLFPTGAVSVPCLPRAGRNTTRCAAAGSRFRFRVEYLNLDAEELSLLLFSLTLSHGAYDLCHKLGYAKALGLGACKVRILNPNPPAIGPEINPYLGDAGFLDILRHRKKQP
jgi:hypothetical protein